MNGGDQVTTLRLVGGDQPKGLRGFGGDQAV